MKRRIIYLLFALSVTFNLVVLYKFHNYNTYKDHLHKAFEKSDYKFKRYIYSKRNELGHKNDNFRDLKKEFFHKVSDFGISDEELSELIDSIALKASEFEYNTCRIILEYRKSRKNKEK